MRRKRVQQLQQRLVLRTVYALVIERVYQAHHGCNRRVVLQPFDILADLFDRFVQQDFMLLRVGFARRDLLEQVPHPFQKPPAPLDRGR